MKYFLSSCLLLFAFYIPANAQVVTFQKVIGGSGAEYLYGAVQTSDSGFVLAGVTESYGAGSIDYYLVKLDKNGDLVWTRTYGGAGGDFEPAFIQTADGGFAFLGSSYSFGNKPRAYLVKLDKAGNVSWSKIFSGIDVVYGSALEQAADGGFLIGTSNVISSQHSATIIKTDSLGNVLWGRNFTNSEWIKDIASTNDGGFVAIGESYQTSTVFPDMYILRFDSSLNITWAKKLDLSTAYTISQTKDCGFIITNGGLLKLDSIGNVEWQMGYVFQMFSARETEKGGFLITSQTSDFGATDAIMAETDSLGQLLWSKTYGISGPEQGDFAINTLDGGYMMAGIRYGMMGPPSKLYIVKTDSLANSGCFEMTVSANDSLYPKVTTGFASTISNAPDNSQLVTTSVGTGGSVNTLCTSVDVRELEFSNDAVIYPNPACDVLRIRMTQRDVDEVSVCDVVGKSVKVDWTRKGDEILLNVNHLSPGIYIITYKAGQKSMQSKFYKD